MANFGPSSRFSAENRASNIFTPFLPQLAPDCGRRCLAAIANRSRFPEAAAGAMTACQLANFVLFFLFFFREWAELVQSPTLEITLPIFTWRLLASLLVFVAKSSVPTSHTSCSRAFPFSHTGRGLMPSFSFCFSPAAAFDTVKLWILFEVRTRC